MAEGKTAVVAGGTGGIGEGIVKALIVGGWDVFVPTRAAEQGERLKAYLGDSGPGRLKLVSADLSSANEVSRFRKSVSTVGVDLVVVSVGSSYYGYSLHKIPEGDWNRIVQENLATHFHLQHEFLDQLHSQDRGVYITLTGPGPTLPTPKPG